MNINEISGILDAQLLQPTTAPAKSDSVNGFSSWLQKEIDVANTQLNDADKAIRSYAIGETDNLHQVMMSIAKAKTSFELVVQVRNRLLEGYQEIMRMQV
jgi:flagellar hook-basal body complex protein FliE